MITDQDSNIVYFSSLLRDTERYASFFKRLTRLLDNLKIRWGLLEGTRAIWARDYMPVQVSKSKFVQFDYYPSYLDTPRYRKTITDGDVVARALGIRPKRTDLKLDGGNLVKSTDSVIMTTRVFSENEGRNPQEILKTIKALLEVKKVILIPDEDDYYGHADGMVRFASDNLVLINEYPDKDSLYFYNLIAALHNAGLKYLTIPCRTNNKNAMGLYINYLQIGQTIILPEYGIKEDAKVVKVFKNVFPRYRIASVRSDEIAQDGGVLNCISWNFFENH